METKIILLSETFVYEIKNKKVIEASNFEWLCIRINFLIPILAFFFSFFLFLSLSYSGRTPMSLRLSLSVPKYFHQRAWDHRQIPCSECKYVPSILPIRVCLYAYASRITWCRWLLPAKVAHDHRSSFVIARVKKKKKKSPVHISPVLPSISEKVLHARLSRAKKESCTIKSDTKKFVSLNSSCVFRDVSR